jgi:hypothetical protein
VDDDLLRNDLDRLRAVRPDVYELLLEDPTAGFPPEEDLIETGLFSELEDGLLYLPQGVAEKLPKPDADSV